jgi:transcriptional regulator with XRE-family HTH domain
MSAAALQLKKSLADAIRHQMKLDHLSISTFARKTKTNRNSVRRILDGKNTSITLKTMAKAAEVLNLELTLSVKQLPLAKLERIAGKLAATDDSKKAAELKKQFLEGYYGRPVGRLDA